MNLNVFIVSNLPLDPLLLHPKAGVNNFNMNDNTINLDKYFKSKIICIIDFIMIFWITTHSNYVVCESEKINSTLHEHTKSRKYNV